MRVRPEDTHRGAMRAGARGFTLIELMTVIAVAAILMAVAFPSFTYLSATTKVKSTATELFLALIRARSEAVKRNASVTIAPAGASWSAGWTIFVDTNNDGDFDTGERDVINQGALSGVSVTAGVPVSGVCTAPLPTVVFLTTGRIQGASAPCFLVASSKDPTIKRCITADLTGRPFIKTDASTCP